MIGEGKLIMMGIGLGASALALPFVGQIPTAPIPDTWYNALTTGGEKGILSIVVIALTIALLTVVKTWRKDALAVAERQDQQIQATAAMLQKAIDVMDKCKAKQGGV